MPLYDLREPVTTRPNTAVQAMQSFLLARRAKKQQAMQDREMSHRERGMGLEEEMMQFKRDQLGKPEWGQPQIAGESDIYPEGSSYQVNRSGKYSRLHEGEDEFDSLMKEYLVQLAISKQLDLDPVTRAAAKQKARAAAVAMAGQKAGAKEPGIEKVLSEGPVAPPAAPRAEGALMPNRGNESAPVSELAAQIERIKAEGASTQLPTTAPPAGGPTSREVPPSEWRMKPVDKGTSASYDRISRSQGDTPPDGIDKGVWAKLGGNTELKNKIRSAMSTLQGQGLSRQEAAKRILESADVQEALSGGK